MKKQSFQFLLKITSIFDKTWRLLLSIRRFYHIPHSPNNGDFRLKSRFPIKSSELVYISSSVRFITPCLHAKSSAFFHIFSILRFSLHFTLITVSMVTHKSRLWRHTAGSCAWMVTFKRVLLSLSLCNRVFKRLWTECCVSRLTYTTRTCCMFHVLFT